jgi:hypothetical protein
MKFGDVCEWLGQTWRYIGMCEDGVVHLCRPMDNIKFDLIEFTQVYSDDLAEFYLEQE